MRSHILAAIIGVSIVAVLILGVPLGVAVSRLYVNEEMLRLQRQGAEATRAIDAASMDSGDPVELPRPPDHTSVAVYSAAGVRVGGRGSRRADALARRALHGYVAQQHAGGSIAVALPISRGETVIGAIRTSTPSDVVTERVHHAWLLMTAIGLGAIAIAAFIGVLVAKRLTGPVESLVDDACRLGDGDFATPARRSGVAELDQVSNALDATARRLGTALERERQFSTDASHQLRTPIAAARVQLEAAQLDPRVDPRAAIAAALPQLDRLERTVVELLALARDARNDAAPLALRQILDEIECNWRGRLAVSGRPLSVRVDPDLPTVHASGAATRQIIEVLVDNAARHGAGTVAVSARRAAGGVVVDVTDEGPGIAGTVEAIWIRGVGRGHGIGLPLARSLAEADGGRLVLERARPHPTFALVLPTRQADTAT